MNEVLGLTELPPAETALQIYQTPNGLDPYIERVRQEVMGHPVDLSTKKGRDAIASRAFKVRKIKSAMDGLGKQQVDSLKEIPKLIDAERKRMREAFDAMAEEVRRPLTEWEQAEENRIAGHKAIIEYLRSAGANLSDVGADALESEINSIQGIIVDESLDEFEAEAHRAKATTLESLQSALAARRKQEADAAELAELRRKQAEQEQKDREARIAQEAAEKARADAEAKAQADREAAAKREADAKAAAEKAERDRLDAIEQQKQAEARAEAEKLAAEQRAKDAAEAARLAEIKRQADAKAAEEAARKKREADIAHKAAINNAALAAFVENGLREECAKQAVILIARGVIPAVSIIY